LSRLHKATANPGENRAESRHVRDCLLLARSRVTLSISESGFHSVGHCYRTTVLVLVASTYSQATLTLLKSAATITCTSTASTRKHLLAPVLSTYSMSDPKTANSKESGVQVEGGTLQDRLRLLEEQKQRDAAKLKKTSDIVVEGGGLKDRLKLLEEQRQREAAKLTPNKGANEPVSDELIRDRLKMLADQQSQNAASPEKAAIVVEGGGLKDRLKLLDEQRQKEAAKLTKTAQLASTDDLIKERLKWMEEQSKQSTLEKAAIIIEGGGIKDRLKLLEFQREQEAARLASRSANMAEVSDDLIRERLLWMDEQQQQLLALDSGSGTNRAVIVVQGGNLQERLRLLEEQKRRQAERAGQKEDLSGVSDNFIQERLQWMDEQMKQQQQHQGARGSDIKDANVVIRGGSLQLRKRLLAEQHRREAERLAVRRLVDVSSKESVQSRMQWLAHQHAAHQHTPQQQELMSNDLIVERLNQLRESAEKAAQLPEKERVEVTNQLVEQRKAWLDEHMQKAAQLPPKERIEVSQGLIAERMGWLEQQMKRADQLTHKERTRMTTELISERLAYLEAQIQANAANDEAKASLEMQINFLEEQQENADQMTDEEQLTMTNVLITEKLHDLEQQKELIAEITEEEQIIVTQALLEDRQAWLEGDHDHYVRKRAEQKQAQEEAEARALEEQQTAARLADEVAHAVAFWTQQKDIAVEMSVAERAQIAAFLIAEHVVSLEMQLEDPSLDEETKASLQQQISFLNDQMESIDDIDHIMMIDVLVQEKVANLERMLLA
jgi:hypothetical protein